MLPIVARSEWGARDSKLVEKFLGPIPFVIIHHSYIPAACYEEEACEAAMRKMQDMHQIKNGWNDIGYSFAIGGDGRIYHGRGYNVIGAHAPRYNDKSIGICLIGDWTSKNFCCEFLFYIFMSLCPFNCCFLINFHFLFFVVSSPLAKLPPKQMLNATKALIQYSLDRGYLATNYKLLGHRQVRDTECPGQRLFEEIISWNNFSSKPAGPEDPEIPN
jgi:peptidoglycan-recognition protein LB